MANICTTQIKIFGHPKSIKKIEEFMENCNDDAQLIDEYGSEGDSTIDKIGCKWIQREDYYTEEDNQYFLQTETAWYPPNIMIENIYKMLMEFPENQNPDKVDCYIEGRYWDENFSPIGVFGIDGDGKYISDETDVDVDWDDEYYWDNQVEPEFEMLDV